MSHISPCVQNDTLPCETAAIGTLHYGDGTIGTIGTNGTMQISTIATIDIVHYSNGTIVAIGAMQIVRERKQRIPPG